MVVVGVLLAIALIFILSLLFGFPFMWLWNWLMPVLFKLPEIDFWQAVGLMILSGMLFRSSSTSTKG